MAEEEKTSLIPKSNEAVSEKKEESGGRNDNSSDKKTIYFLPKNPSQTNEVYFNYSFNVLVNLL